MAQIKNASILLISGKNMNRICFVLNKDNTWHIPGGTIDPGETPYQAAIREFNEEYRGFSKNPRDYTPIPGAKLYGFYDRQHSNNTITRIFIMSTTTNILFKPNDEMIKSWWAKIGLVLKNLDNAIGEIGKKKYIIKKYIKESLIQIFNKTNNLTNLNNLEQEEQKEDLENICNKYLSDLNNDLFVNKIVDLIRRKDPSNQMIVNQLLIKLTDGGNLKEKNLIKLTDGGHLKKEIIKINY